MTARRSFGLINPAVPKVLDPGASIALLKTGTAEAGSLLGYGNGRSYGDSCLNGQGAVVDMRPMNRILAFDPVAGMIEAEAGVLLSEIIAYIAPHGFFPAVVPGTQFVTLGGAIANDIHGKNHHRRGTFGCHVEALTLLTSDGRIHRLKRCSKCRLFVATIGGMGLTGLILSATVRLMRVPSLDIEEEITPFRGFDEYFDVAEAADDANEYAVAWTDQLAIGRREGRGLLITGNHAEFGARKASDARRWLGVPFGMPVCLLNRPFLKLFNSAYWCTKSKALGKHKTAYQGFFFPLDGVADWNRLYGPKGLYQHQSVFPNGEARKTVPALLAAAREAGHASFLTVLKRFGGVASPGLISFPRSGYTLTLDFPNRGADTLALLERLDRITVEFGGAVNPYKDARMAPEVFAASFPTWRDLEMHRDPAFLSDFWRRTAIRLSTEAGSGLAAE
ncbi:FAD/FMN-containing dehydrogenase [Bradyrhizobium sp. CIR18]|uniref:FAD-binding oxidoreductase n=1 Tax=Bradyrhizobium sp. CIR18 TaxID=2663839 RepID=UPI001606AEF6|nr:FAD-binding oxidoreductase [Bradyrhizobium sp. CIR18]MBB4365292.1 FAD/FMN-containing dehydrogenase [Bradyrhizobium sp. CIR18]